MHSISENFKFYKHMNSRSGELYPPGHKLNNKERKNKTILKCMKSNSVKFVDFSQSETGKFYLNTITTEIYIEINNTLNKPCKRLQYFNSTKLGL